jgi:F-type H+-transporting ATPase subunit epsilon
MRFELATPARQLVSAEVDEVVVPGVEGYFGVWPGHAPFLTTLKPGELMYRQGREERHVAVMGGFAEVTPDRVIVLAEQAELPEEIDLARAERAKQRAEIRLAGRSPDGRVDEGGIDFARALEALARSLTRLVVAGRARQLAGARAH